MIIVADALACFDVRREQIMALSLGCGQPRDTAAVTRLQAMDYEGAVLRLPQGCRCSHLFIRRLTHDRVEVASAAPMELYDRTEPVRPGETDPVAGCVDRNGRFAAPEHLMGVDVVAWQVTRENRIARAAMADPIDKLVPQEGLHVAAPRKRDGVIIVERRDLATPRPDS